jgi:hypothetical protein
MIQIPQNPDPANTDTPVDPNIQETHINRDTPEPDEKRAALVKRLQGDIEVGKRHAKDAFKQMRKDMEFLKGQQWEGGKEESKEKYVANIVLRHVQERVASLYAKNPKAVCRRRKTLDFKIWDETQAMMQEAQTAMMAASQTGMQLDPNAQALMQDIMQGTQKRRMLDRIANTLEIVFAYQLKMQQPVFKKQFKQLIRRTLTTGIGYIKLGYQRYMHKRPEDVEKITDVTQQIVELERIMADLHDDKLDEASAEVEKLRLMLNQLQSQPDVIVREGLAFDFPKSTSVIVDPKCTNLDGFVGAQWVAQEFILSPEDIEEIFNVDVGKQFKQYTQTGDNGVALPPNDSKESNSDKGKSLCCAYQIYNKKDGLVYHIVDGYPDFLKEPAAPDIDLERFWPFFTLVFNQIEDDEDIWPLSDVFLLRSMQREYNRCRQAMREHRIANRPKYGVPAGLLEVEDKAKLESHPANAVLELKGLAPGQKIEDVLQPIRTVPIQKELYDVEMVFQDTERVVGTQSADFGGLQGDVTATQSSIAESSRVSSISSNIDDIDDMFSELALAAGCVLLREMEPDTVQEIAGIGAAWPQMSANEICKELLLEVEAGSSGKPNKAADIANFGKIAPILLQIPGISPEWMAKETIKRLDDNLDPTDAILSAAQSIVAQNANQQLATGNPATSPNMQHTQPGATPGTGAPALPPGMHPGPGEAAPPPAMVHQQQ